MDRKSTPTGVEIRAASLADAINEARRLTARDHTIIQLLAEHRVITADQAAALGFPNDTRARHRLLLLTRRGVLARFRRHVWPGSQPWHYTLGLLGEAIHAAQTGAPLPRPIKVQEKIIRLSQSRTLDHLIGVNDTFLGLIRHATTHPDTALTEWWPERKIGETVGEIVRPDGYGEWTEHNRTVAFFLEYDNGTEQLGHLTAKLDKYAELADAGITRPVLFVFPTTPRLTHFHQLAHRHDHPRRVTVAATALDQLTATGLGPADRIWLPVGRTHRVRLIDLPPTVAPRPAGHPAGWTHDETSVA